MRFALFCTSFLVLVLSGCNQDSSVDSGGQRATDIEQARKVRQQAIEQLAWVDTADAKEMAKHDIAAKRYRFFSVCGYACQIVGVGSLQAERCYSSVVEERINGTGDNVSGELARLNTRAYEFATQYNRYVANYLAEHGQRKCSSAADWDGALDALSRFVWSLPKDDKYSGDVGVSTGKPTFTVRLPRGVSTESVLPKLCEIVQSHGLVASEATFEIVGMGHWGEGPTMDHVKFFQCGEKARR